MDLRRDVKTAGKNIEEETRLTSLLERKDRADCFSIADVYNAGKAGRAARYSSRQRGVVVGAPIGGTGTETGAGATAKDVAEAARADQQRYLQKQKQKQKENQNKQKKQLRNEFAARAFMNMSIIEPFLEMACPPIVFTGTRSDWLTRAVEAVQRAPQSPDPRAHCFEAGVYFADLRQDDRAGIYLARAAVRTDPCAVVKARLALDQAESARRLDRLSAHKRAALLLEREIMFARAVEEEEERQRRRVRTALLLLAAIHVRQSVPVETHLRRAHEHLRAALTECVDDNELLLAMGFLHDVLCCYLVNPEHLEVGSDAVNAARDVLADAHIEILLRLVDLDSGAPTGNVSGYLRWLGQRYSEKGRFDKSRDYYERARYSSVPGLQYSAELLGASKPQLDEPSSPGSELRDEADTHTLSQISLRERRERSRRSGLTASANNKTRHYEFAHQAGCRVDEEAARARDDYARFGGVHKGATTLIYQPPVLGWDEDA